MPQRIHLSLGDEQWTVDVPAGPDGVAVTRVGDRLRAVAPDGTEHTGAAAVTGDTIWVTVGGEVFAFAVTHGARARGAGRDHDALTPPMSATVVRVAVKPGDHVKDGDVLIALEAMKMELPIRSPRDGVIRAVHCQVGELVQPGDTLIELAE